jgi:hypothetical protein
MIYEGSSNFPEELLIWLNVVGMMIDIWWTETKVILWMVPDEFSDCQEPRIWYVSKP